MIYERVTEDRISMCNDSNYFFLKKDSKFHFDIFINAMIIIMRLFKVKTIKEY